MYSKWRIARDLNLIFVVYHLPASGGRGNALIVGELTSIGQNDQYMRNGP